MGDRRKPESIVPLPPGAEQLATHLRSTMLSSSVTSLRERGLFERYLAALPEQHHEAILLTLAPTWLPMEVALSHYVACDSLGLTAEEVTDIGRDVGRRIQATFLGTMARGSRAVGATPWLALEQAPKLWGRMIRGGGIAVERTGPKDAQILLTGVPMARHGYCRFATAGIIESGANVFSKRAFVRVAPALCTDDQMGFFGSWV